MKTIYLTIYLFIVTLLFLLQSCGNNSINPSNNNPIIDNLSLTTFCIGSEIIIYGRNFGTTRDSSYVLFNQIITSQIIAWDSVSIQLSVPMSVISGNIYVVVGNKKSNPITYLIIDRPSVEGNWYGSHSYNYGTTSISLDLSLSMKDSVNIIGTGNWSISTPGGGNSRPVRVEGTYFNMNVELFYETGMFNGIVLPNGTRINGNISNGEFVLNKK